ncbi:hypothetical protein [Pseudonocardia sp. EV170527-09]|uniref:hypothetical protein n=1 Tax=Pseudonocardia sp. EV170527-09 TaxID=2603411 RepID=UPI00138696F2|nr:hypothetical protein [Pseudonocardia sp. EV170527-09]
MVDLVGRAALRRGLTTTEAVDRWYDHHADGPVQRTVVPARHAGPQRPAGWAL